MLADGPLDGCGNSGTLEAVASRLAIAGSAAQAAYRGHAPHLMENVGTNVAEIRSAMLTQSIESGDRMVQEIVEHASRQLGRAVITVVQGAGITRTTQ